MPFLAVLLLAPMSLLRAYRDGRYGLMASLAVLLAVGALELLCVSCFSAAMRYCVDFASFFVLAALLVIFDVDSLCQRWLILKWSFRTGIAAALTAGCLFNLGISIEGQRQLKRDLAVRDRLRKVFPNLTFLDGHMNVRLRVAFPDKMEPGHREPLLVTGKKGAGDFIFVRYLGDDTVAFSFDHWGRPERDGSALRVIPGRSYLFEANLRPADSKVICSLDGQEVLEVDTDLYPFWRWNLRIGTNPIGGGLFTSETFSGTVQRE
jgi:hypothetical protein